MDRSSSSSCLEGSNQRGNGDCGTDPREFAYYKYTKHKTKQKQSEQNVWESLRRVCLALFWNMNSSTNCSFWGLLSVRLGNNFTALGHCRLFRYIICNQIWAFYGFIFWNRPKQYNWRDLKEKEETAGGTGGEGRERQEKTEDEETESKRVQPDTPPGWGGDDFDANRQLDSGSSGLRFWLLQKQTNKQTNDKWQQTTSISSSRLSSKPTIKLHSKKTVYHLWRWRHSDSHVTLCNAFPWLCLPCGSDWHGQEARPRPEHIWVRERHLQQEWQDLVISGAVLTRVQRL